jgi:hypothetical protein
LFFRPGSVGAAETAVHVSDEEVDKAVERGLLGSLAGSFRTERWGNGSAQNTSGNWGCAAWRS